MQNRSRCRPSLSLRLGCSPRPQSNENEGLAACAVGRPEVHAAGPGFAGVAKQVGVRPGSATAFSLSHKTLTSNQLWPSGLVVSIARSAHAPATIQACFGRDFRTLSIDKLLDLGQLANALGFWNHFKLSESMVLYGMHPITFERLRGL